MSRLTIGIDVGATFTDVICYDQESRRFHVAKVPSTSEDPSGGCMDALNSLNVSKELIAVYASCPQYKVFRLEILTRRPSRPSPGAAVR